MISISNFAPLRLIRGKTSGRQRSGTPRYLLLLPVLALLNACTPGTMIETIADEGKEQIARDYIQRLVEPALPHCPIIPQVWRRTCI